MRDNFYVGDTVFFLNYNEISSGKILERTYGLGVEYMVENYNHGRLSEYHVFKDSKSLIDSLLNSLRFKREELERVKKDLALTLDILERKVEHYMKTFDNLSEALK